MKAFVDKELCIGCELCVSICPNVFHIDADDKAKATAAEIDVSLMDEVKEAVAQCPVEAIQVE